MTQNIRDSFEALPEFLNSQHLVELGLYSSVDAAYLARVRGHSPHFLKLKRKVLYPKSSVIEFIEQSMERRNSSHIKADEHQ